MTVSPIRKRATSEALGGGAICLPAAVGRATVGDLEFSKKSWSCDGELQPVKTVPAASAVQANNPRTNNFMGANSCESGDAINILV